MPTSTDYERAVDLLAEATASLATLAAEQGTPRAQAAADLTARVHHAAVTDPAVEQAREQLRADLAEHHAAVTAYTASTGQLGRQLCAFLDQLAALADDVIASTGQAQALDERGHALADAARSLGEPVGVMPSVVEDTVQRLRHEPDGVLLQRLFLAARQGHRSPVVATLADLTQRLRPGR